MSRAGGSGRNPLELEAEALIMAEALRMKLGLRTLDVVEVK